MNQVIIYKNDTGGVALVIPTEEWLAIEGNTMEVLAQKDVPTGKEYKIVDASEIPDDHTFFNAWEWSE